MNDIALAVEQLARAIEDQPDEVRIWAAASFAGCVRTIDVGFISVGIS